MSFYRTYRPQTVAEVDNESVKKTLLTLLKKEKGALPHAYLFCGPRGTGKTTAARLVAKCFLCTSPQKSGEPCGTCDQCTAIAQGRAIDVIEIDAASNTGVDNIRDLKDKIHLSPSQGEWKIYIIDEVHMLSTGAFNALLKTLEEPPKHAVFVLATTDPQKVPLTVQSRCMVVQFQRPKEEEVKQALQKIISQEKLKIPDDALQEIILAADGSFRDAVKLLEQVSLSDGTLSAERVRSVIGVGSDELTRQFLEFLHAKDVQKTLETVEKAVTAGSDMRLFLTQSIKMLEGFLHASVTKGDTNGWSKGELLDSIRLLSEAYKEIRIVPIPELPVKLAVVEWCDPTVRKNSNPLPPTSPYTAKKVDKPTAVSTPVKAAPEPKTSEEAPVRGLITLEKITQHWADILSHAKTYNHSIAGVLRSTRPKSAENGIVVIEAYYTFHKDKLSELKTREALAGIFKKLFGETVTVEIVMGKK